MSWYVFDFDGVLFDTARECLSIAYETARRHRDRWPRFSTLRDDEPPAELAASFLAHRHWVGPPWQYAVLLEAILDDDMPTTTTEFLARATSRRAGVEPFTEVYFATRQLLAADLERWTSVITPYDESTRSFVALHRRGVASVLSTRDDASIRKLLEYFLGISIDGALLPRSGPLEKWQILLAAATTRGLAPQRVFFLDDYVAHARPARERGVAAHLACWGYLANDDINEAQRAGIPCVALADLDLSIAAHEREDST